MEKMQRYNFEYRYDAPHTSDMEISELGEYVKYDDILSRLEWERKRAKWYVEMIGKIIWESQEFEEDRKRKRDFHVLVEMYNHLVERSGRQAVV